MQITKLTENGKANQVAISPDGRYIVYAMRDGEKQSLWVRNVATKSDVQVLAPDVVEIPGLSFSPDGNYIYFVRSDKSTENFRYLYQMPVLGGSPRQLIRDIDSSIDFSPDGSHFVFERGVPDRSVIEVWTTQADGTGERLVATLPAYAGFMFGRHLVPGWQHPRSVNPGRRQRRQLAIECSSTSRTAVFAPCSLVTEEASGGPSGCLTATLSSPRSGKPR